MLDSRKLEFVKMKTENASINPLYIELYFNKALPLETELNKDLSEFSIDEIFRLYKSLDMHSFENLYVLNSVFGQYTNWCIENSSSTAFVNNYLLIIKDDIYNCLNKAKLNSKIIDKKTLYNELSILPNGRDKVVVMGMFEGLKGKDYHEIWGLKPKECDLENLQIHLVNRTISISEEFASAIYQSMTETKYIALTGEEQRMFDLQDVGYVIKWYINQTLDSNEFQKGRNIYYALYRVLNKIGFEHLTGNDIVNSGKIHYINSNAQKLNISGAEYLKKHLAEMKNQFGGSIVYSNFIKKFGDHLIK